MYPIRKTTTEAAKLKRGSFMSNRFKSSPAIGIAQNKINIQHMANQCSDDEDKNHEINPNVLDQRKIRDDFKIEQTDKPANQ